MTNITEADHDAVDWLYEMGVIAPHHLRLANEAFARHREQTERQAADRIEALEAEVERLREAVEGAQEILAECSVSFGVCICGEDMQTHGTSHTPTDQAHIAVKRWLEEARAALGEKQ